jgi:hypothetical protein
VGPLFNPMYWLFGLAFLVAAVCASIVAGFVTYIVSSLFAKRQPKNRSFPIIIAIVITPVVFCLTLGSLCQWSFSNPTNPRKKPAREDIVGVWVPTPSSLQKMQEEGMYEISTHTLAFKKDGTFVMTNMPDWWINSFGESAGGFYSGSGTWEITKDRGRWEIRVHFTSLPGYRNGLTTSFNLSGQESPYRIYLYLGDPDSYRVMVFERQ